MANFKEASVSAFQLIFDNANSVAAWFHDYLRPPTAITKRTNKLNLKTDGTHAFDFEVQNMVIRSP